MLIPPHPFPGWGGDGADPAMGTGDPIHSSPPGTGQGSGLVLNPATGWQLPHPIRSRPISAAQRANCSWPEEKGHG